jgi:hypothetical protein
MITNGAQLAGMRLAAIARLDQLFHGNSERLGASNLRACFQFFEGPRSELHGGI